MEQPKIESPEIAIFTYMNTEEKQKLKLSEFHSCKQFHILSSIFRDHQGLTVTISHRK